MADTYEEMWLAIKKESVGVNIIYNSDPLFGTIKSN